MPFSLSQIFVAALAATAVSALPQGSPAPATAPQPGDNTAFIQSLDQAPTAIARFQKLFTKDGTILSKDDLAKQIVFDFNNPQPAPGAKGGAVKAANIQTFPVLTKLSISSVVGVLNPCGLNTPHIHPRATEFQTVIDGEIDFGFIVENGLVSSGSSEVAGTVKKLQGTVFPAGSIHYQFNPTCKPATFVATLNSEDPGTSQIAQNFFGLNGDIVRATVGNPESFDGEELESFRNQIPPNVALAIENCMAVCRGPKDE